MVLNPSPRTVVFGQPFASLDPDQISQLSPYGIRMILAALHMPPLLNILSMQGSPANYPPIWFACKYCSVVDPDPTFHVISDLDPTL